MLFKTYLESPLGILQITGDQSGVSSLLFDNKFARPDNPGLPCLGCPDPVLACRSQLNEFFKGWRKEFDLVLQLAGTPFQKKIWRLLHEIPFGTTLSYTELAIRAGDPLAVRAVAAAVAKNKINIVVPCHRIVGAHGHLTGYGGELWRKKWLLEFEKPVKQTILF
jgi:methylated-DNA-[protein]-cysteine S-methyltransferase